jgi:hypothetical protein
VDASDLDAGVLLDVDDGGTEGAAIESISVQRLDVEDELTALGAARLPAPPKWGR